MIGRLAGKQVGGSGLQAYENPLRNYEKGQSCSSQGYRMAAGQSECEGIAIHLGLSDTSAHVWSEPGDCDGQGYYRCEYDSTNLYWNPDCADNSNSQDQGGNLCTLGICKINQNNVRRLLIIINVHHYKSFANQH